MLSEHVKSRIIQLRSRVRLFSHDARTGADLETELLKQLQGASKISQNDPRSKATPNSLRL